MIAKTIAFPERVFSAIRLSPDEFISQMRLAAAIKCLLLAETAAYKSTYTDKPET